ncbi:GHKL domain-containing protein, partial [Paeniclostridium sordellii]|nr:GHKL domain-containing protein [Paeniclostridium sordellii]
FKTLKKDKINHGIGIENLKITISKYDGIIDFMINENSFKVNFIIPL